MTNKLLIVMFLLLGAGLGLAAPYVWTVDSAGNGTYTGNLTVNGQLNVAGPWTVASPVPTTPMAAAPAGESSLGFSNDGNFYVSVKGGAPAMLALATNQVQVGTVLTVTLTCPKGSGTVGGGFTSANCTMTVTGIP